MIGGIFGPFMALPAIVLGYLASLLLYWKRITAMWCWVLSGFTSGLLNYVIVLDDFPTDFFSSHDLFLLPALVGGGTLCGLLMGLEAVEPKKEKIGLL